MRFAKSAFEVLRAHSLKRGCTVFEPLKHRFVSPDGKHHVRFVESRGDIVFVWDTQEPIGRVALRRAG